MELPFSYTLNLRNVGLNSRPKPKKKRVQICPPPRNFELDTVKDIISSLIITFTRYLLNKFDLRNYNLSQVKKHIKLL